MAPGRARERSRYGIRYWRRIWIVRQSAEPFFNEAFACSLDAFTLPHELARLVLAEQLYRAGTILRGEPYHK